jgi:O-antigen/teichoic acid export membrane protein
LEYFRRQRELEYLPSALYELVPQAAVTLAAWPLAVWLRDFRVIVWLLVGKAGLGILMTHWLAKRPYSCEWRRDYAKQMWTFAWPLLLNGLLMFAAQQADQMLVGAFLSMENLAAYALAFSLASIPWFVFGQVGSSIMLPILSRAQDNPELFRRHYRVCVEYAAVGSVVLTLPLIVSGEQLVTLLYGPKYAGTGVVTALLAATTAVRFLRFAPAVAAMARADTLNQLYSNLWRGISLPGAALIAILGGGAPLIAACALAAEMLAALVSVFRLRQRQGVPLRETAVAAAHVLGFVAAGLALVYLGASRWGLLAAAAGMAAVLVLSILVAYAVFPAFARSVLDLVRRTDPSGVQHPASN